jgi:hypothetical protein
MFSVRVLEFFVWSYDRGVDEIAEICGRSLEILPPAIDGNRSALASNEVVNVFALDLVPTFSTPCRVS